MIIPAPTLAEIRRHQARVSPARQADSVASLVVGSPISLLFVGLAWG